MGIVPEQAYVNDVNEQLINLYIQLKIAVEAVLEKVKELDAVPVSYTHLTLPTIYSVSCKQ